MENVVNNPPSGEGSGMGMIVGVLVAIVLVVLFVVYVLPTLRSNQAPANNGGVDLNVTVPAGSGSTPPNGGAAY